MNRQLATARPRHRVVVAILGLTFRATPVATVFSITITIAAGIAPAGSAYAAKLLIDTLSHRGAIDATRALQLGVLSVVLAGTASAASFVSSYLAGYMQQSVLRLAEDRLYARVNSFSGLRYLEDPVFHDRVRMAEAAVQSAPNDMTVFLVGSIRQIATASAYFSVLISIWPPMAVLLTLAAAPAIAAQVILSGQAARATNTSVSGQRWRYYYRALLTDPVVGKEVRLFGLGALFHGRMMDALNRSLRVELVQNKRATLTEFWFTILNTAVAAVGAGVVVHAVIAQRVTVGDATLFLAAAASVQGAFSAVIVQFGRTNTSLLRFVSYLDIMDAPDDVEDGAGAVDRLVLGIEFHDVWFRYTKAGPWVLQGLTLSIPAGSNVGIVGINGAGKSTLVKLLLRFYEPEKGHITWDEIDLRNLRISDLRRRVRASFQDFVSYDITAQENIGIGDVDDLFGRDRVRAAAQVARVDLVLAELPNGYDALLSRTHSDDRHPSGAALSGGQWQRIALARSLVRREADLLILDEPSSGLDPEAEHGIQRELAVVRHGRTNLVISHRLNIMRDVDIIFVLRDGSVAECGTHDYLMVEGGIYERLFRLQASGYLDTVLR